MKSSDPAYQALFEVWTAESADQTWRVRFNDGGIAVFTAMLAHEDEVGIRNGLGTVVRQIRASADRTWSVKDETFFSMSDVKDVTHLESGDIVFPPEQARKRPVSVVGGSTQVDAAQVPQPHFAARAGAASVALVGVLLIVWGIHNTLARSERMSWPKAPAFVDYLAIIQEKSSNRGSISLYYVPRVSYRFSVNGRNYVGSAIVQGESFSEDSRDALRKSIPFKQGDTVQAFYNPADPSDAVLIPDAGMERIVGLFLLAPVVLFGAFLWWHSTMPQKKGLYPD